MPSSLRTKFEGAVESSASFRMSELAEETWSEIEGRTEVSEAIHAIRSLLSAQDYSKLCHSIVRSVFLIELVKLPKVESTKFRVRWADQLQDDPRYCSFDECVALTDELLTSLPDWLDERDHLECLRLSLNHRVLPYEAPIDYGRRKSAAGRLHELGNLAWFQDELMLRTLKLRKYLTDSDTSPDSQFFKTLLTDKIRVKTYLTDRAQTGAHKTNREKRWETHPDSVQFAERRTCMAIEYALVTQVCAFDGFPLASLDLLREAGILPANLPTALCPITGDELSYEAFRDELLNPTHGKSAFQVGHLNPLKLGDLKAAASGHTAENVSWISADGNRIQGSLSLDDVRLLVKRIAENYERHGW